jgi:hypothetical protein
MDYAQYLYAIAEQIEANRLKLEELDRRCPPSRSVAKRLEAQNIEHNIRSRYTGLDYSLGE